MYGASAAARAAGRLRWRRLRRRLGRGGRRAALQTEADGCSGGLPAERRGGWAAGGNPLPTVVGSQRAPPQSGAQSWTGGSFGQPPPPAGGTHGQPTCSPHVPPPAGGWSGARAGAAGGGRDGAAPPGGGWDGAAPPAPVGGYWNGPMPPQNNEPPPPPNGSARRTTTGRGSAS